MNIPISLDTAVPRRISPGSGTDGKLCPRTPTKHTRSLPYISKSTFLNGLQCPKLLWTRYNAKEQLPPPDANTEAVFEQGHEVGDLAKKLFPQGIEAGNADTELEQTIVLSSQLLKLRKPLFEAALAHNGAYARADILVPAPQGAWDILEVKSTTEVKDVHLRDLAFQRFVFTGAGLKIRRCVLVHINRGFVRHGQIDLLKFFVRADVTYQVIRLARSIRKTLEGMKATVGLRACPRVQIGERCDEPYTCPLRDRCWSFLPKHNVFTLSRGGKKAFELFSKGVTHIGRIPKDFPLSPLQQIQRNAVRTQKTHIDALAIAAFLEKLEYPVSFLDFETFATAIPLFDGVAPYQQVPFQFSLHVVPSRNAKPEHYGFLAEGRLDPRPQFFSELRRTLPTKGSIVTYNAAFERNVIQAGAKANRLLRTWNSELRPRFIDLLEPFRSFHFYHPAQMGSASIKATLPATTGKGYERQAIQDGATARREFLRATFGDVSEKERQKLHRQLRSYCGLDTAGMFWIVTKLHMLIDGAVIRREDAVNSCQLFSNRARASTRRDST